MNTTAMPDRWAALRCWALRAGFVGAAAFAGTFLVLFAFVFALLGPEQLQSPVFFGLAGPSVASALMRPGLVIAGTMAVVAVAIYSLGVLRGGNHSALRQLRKLRFNTSKPDQPNKSLFVNVCGCSDE